MHVRIVRWVSLFTAAVTLGALTAHVFELPNKLLLEGSLWLAVQQNLYRGWGPFVAPFELTAIFTTWLLSFLVRKQRPIFGLTLLAASLLSVTLGVFFVLNAPVNAAFAAWTIQTLPADWSDYRWRWELGHAIGFGLVLIAFIALLRGLFLAQPRSRQPGSGPAVVD